MMTRLLGYQRTLKRNALSTIAIWIMIMIGALGCMFWSGLGVYDSERGFVVTLTPMPTPTFGPSPTHDPNRTPTLTKTPEDEQSLRNEGFLIDETLFITDESCSLPCWRGIKPGATVWNEAVAILQDQADLTEIRVEDNTQTGEKAVTFQRVGGIPCCLLYSATGEVIEQILLQLSSTYRLETVIESLGEPLYFNGVEVDETQAVAALFYPARDIVIYAFVAGTEGDLMPESEVFAILILAPSDMQEVLNTSTLQAYDGYKSFADYMDDEPVLTPLP